MCNQTVCLIAAELERRGISTVCLMLLREVAEKVQPPRALFVPFPHGFPLGEPQNPRGQRSVIEAALSLTEQEAAPPVLVDFQLSDTC